MVPHGGRTALREQLSARSEVKGPARGFSGRRLYLRRPALARKARIGDCGAPKEEIEGGAQWRE
jgi:hypothetical protein